MIKRQDGLTLVELTIGIALLSTTLVVANLSYTSISRLQQRGIATREVQQSGRYVLEAISRDIRNSDVAVLRSSSGLRLINSLNGSQTIEYSYEGNRVLRRVCGPDGTCGAAVSISGDTVRINRVEYQLGDDPESNFIKIALQVQQSTEGLLPSDNFYQSYDLTTNVALRGQ